MEIQVSVYTFMKPFLFSSPIIDGDLCALIKARQASREQEAGSFFDSLEQKYASGGSSKTRSKKGGSTSSKKATTSSGSHKTRKGKSK